MDDATPTGGVSRTTRVSAVRAFLAGRAAKRRGEDVDACPFDLDAQAEDPSDATIVAAAAIERFNARYWIKGWSRS